MVYRMADPKDVAALRALGMASYGRLKNVLTPENWIKMESVITSDQTFPLLVSSCHSFVCEENSRLLGMAFLVPSGNPTKIYSSDTSYIRMVGVHPDADGKGIAQALTKLCIDKAKETGEKTIMLHSAEIMYAARHIYEKAGFKKVRLLEEHYGLQYWLYQMDIE
ncbi:MAG TPA: GNAT family N-acetyltransferase [Puia sp.]|jgi:ribosomal protein S18 acetylase RimI-like enzyme|nr:GNAT family N-acetyltransferase [Puia sp.]